MSACPEREDCTPGRLTRGLCRRHYHQEWWKENRPPLAGEELARRAEERAWRNYWKRVDKSGECWVWLGPKAANGYGRVGFLGQWRAAHRVSWEALHGPVPEGLELDHLCRVRECVNPGHLEPVTHAENMRRAAVLRTHCAKGHEFTETNTVTSAGYRQCRTCINAIKRAWRARLRAEGQEVA